MVNKKVATLFIAFYLVYPSMAYANDPCSFLSNVQAELETKEGILGTIEKIYKQFHNLIEAPYFQELSSREKGVYFTRQPGFYFTLDCSAEDSNRRIEKIGMFGVGDTFKPLRKRFFSNKVYYFGLRRSGLMSFVREKDLRLMEKDKVYFFNRTITPTNFCTNNNQCSGKQKEFNARYHYAEMKLSEFNKHVNFSRCAILSVAIFNGRKSITSRSVAVPEYRKAQLKYCHTRHDNGIYTNHSSKAENALNNLAITGQYLMLSSKALKDKIPFLFTKKDCLTKKTIKKNSVISLGGSIGAGFDFKLIRASADGGIKVNYDISDEEIFDADKQYLYLNYSTTFHRPADDGVVKVLNDIVVTQTCEESTVPTRLNEIRINILPKEDKLIALDIKELDKVARERFSSSGVWITASSSSRLKGRTWLIASVEQNMQWKKFVFDRVYKDILNIVPPGADKSAVLDHADYYTSLFMATAFEFVPKNRVSEIEIEPRPKSV